MGKEQNNERDIDEKSKNFTTNNISDTNDLPAAKAAAIASSSSKSTPPPVKRPSGNIQLSELIDDAITEKQVHNAPSSTKMSKKSLKKSLH